MLRSLMPKRRILMTVDAVGGVWGYALDLTAGLVQRGHAVVLAGLGPQPTQYQQLEAERIATLVWLEAPLDWMVEDEAALDQLSTELEAVALQHDIDLVHLNAPSQACGLSLRCPIVCVSHSCVVTWFHAVKCEPVPTIWRWQVERNHRGFERSDRVIAPSASHAAMLEECYGPIARLEVVHNSVRPTAPAPVRDSFGFTAGRWWDEGKNGETLERAAAACRWPLSAAGPTTGPNGQCMSFKAVNGLGELPGHEVRALMSEAGIFVSPSLFEPFGLAALEAAVAGTPLLLADIPTYRELWDDAALYFPPSDANALSAAFNTLAADGEFREQLGRAARQRAQEFTAERQLQRMLAIYASVSAELAET
jgi:glycosyltransferase involved in cell wall biosynthesis